MLQIAITNQQNRIPIDRRTVRRAALAALDGQSVEQGRLSLVFVDDPAMHELNRQYLDHDYPTDVLSFRLDEGDGPLDGEVIVSADTAVHAAAAYGWPAGHELLLYVVHGTLHLVGYNDGSRVERGRMRQQERACLAMLGIDAKYRRQPKEESPSRQPRQKTSVRGKKSR